jgi:hypothetical protein
MIAMKVADANNRSSVYLHRKSPESNVSEFLVEVLVCVRLLYVVPET